MSDWPRSGNYPYPIGIISPASDSCQVGDAVISSNQAINTSTTWPVTRLVMYVPILIPFRARIFQLAFHNGSAVSGNVEVGIYDELGNKLVSSGSQTQTGVSTLQLFDIADTDIGPGVIYLASVIDNTTGTGLRAGTAAQLLRVCGMQQQTLGAMPMATTATFTAYAQAWVPMMCAVYQSATF
jgi:hypothetical protein